MPEIPEVEAFKSYLITHCLEKPITDIKISKSLVLQKISSVLFKKLLIGHKFTAAERLGKYLVIDISGSDKKLVIHFGLTGSLFYTPDKHEAVQFSRVQFVFRKSVLHWTCMRNFGKLWLVDDIQSIANLRKLGPDALRITKKQFLALLSENDKALSTVKCNNAGV